MGAGLIGIGVIVLCACANVYAGNAFPAQTLAVSSSPEDTAQAQESIALMLPQASGETVYSENGITLDASHLDQGYFMVKSGENANRLKLRVVKDDALYTYDLPADGEYVALPLQLGDGSYTVQGMENVEGTLYSQIFEARLEVSLASQLLPYMYPNQYVSYQAGDQAVLKSYLLVEGIDRTDTQRIAKTLYNYVAKTIAYDYDKAASVQKGYLPDPDETLESQKGICFDYSALLAAMLRAQGIPVKLVIGYVYPENMYHAWNQVYIDGTWVWMDSTLDGTGHDENDYTEERWY